MIGSARRNENRAADSRVMPVARAAVIVTPDRETPGCSATAWAMPMTTVRRSVRPSSPWSWRARRSTAYRTTPKSASMIAISQGCPSFSSITSSNSAPTMAPGMVPTTRYQARRSSSVSARRFPIERNHAPRYRAMSRRKYPTAPTNVPMCSATSKVLFTCSSCRIDQFPSQGTRIRCPEDDTGANSVRPWTIPSTMAWNTLRCAWLAAATRRRTCMPGSFRVRGTTESTGGLRRLLAGRWRFDDGGGVDRRGGGGGDRRGARYRAGSPAPVAGRRPRTGGARPRREGGARRRPRGAGAHPRGDPVDDRRRDRPVRPRRPGRVREPGRAGPPGPAVRLGRRGHPGLAPGCRRPRRRRAGRAGRVRVRDRRADHRGVGHPRRRRRGGRRGAGPDRCAAGGTGPARLRGQRVARAEDPGARARFLERLELEAIRLTRLVGDLLDLSRLEGGLAESEVVDVGRVVTDEVDRLRPRAEGAGLRLVVDAPDRVEVRGSESDLGLMVHNLLDNAIRYSPDGGEVRATLSTGGGLAELRIADTGLGIPARDLDRVFERFYRVDPARSRSTGGTGLGLAIVRHVAQSHGGDVEVRSVLGAGSTFIVRLPLAGT